MTNKKNNIKGNEHEQDMLYKMGLWLSKFLTDYNADKFVYKLEHVSGPENKDIGDFELTFKKIK